VGHYISDDENHEKPVIKQTASPVDKATMDMLVSCCFYMYY